MLLECWRCCLHLFWCSSQQAGAALLSPPLLFCPPHEWWSEAPPAFSSFTSALLIKLKVTFFHVCPSFPSQGHISQRLSFLLPHPNCCSGRSLQPSSHPYQCALNCNSLTPLPSVFPHASWLASCVSWLCLFLPKSFYPISRIFPVHLHSTIAWDSFSRTESLSLFLLFSLPGLSVLLHHLADSTLFKSHPWWLLLCNSLLVHNSGLG